MGEFSDVRENSMFHMVPIVYVLDIVYCDLIDASIIAVSTSSALCHL